MNTVKRPVQTRCPVCVLNFAVEQATKATPRTRPKNPTKKTEQNRTQLVEASVALITAPEYTHGKQHKTLALPLWPK